MHRGILEKSDGWIVFPVNEQKLGWIFATAGVAVVQFSLAGKYRFNEKQSHILGGLLRSLTEIYSDFAFDPSVHASVEKYLFALAEDFKSGNNKEIYPDFSKSVMMDVCDLNENIAAMDQQYFSITYKMISIYADLLRDAVESTMQVREQEYNLIT
jgi:hypothetical protein